MTPVSFIVEIRVDDPSPESLVTLAEDISDQLQSIGDVISVRPYARPTIGLTPDLIQQQSPNTLLGNPPTI